MRLHDARHTCATLMHLQGVPIALVAAWLGHADVSFTLRTYVHAQPEALEVGGAQLCFADIERQRLRRSHTRCGDTNQSVVTICDNFRCRRTYVHQREMETPAQMAFLRSG